MVRLVSSANLFHRLRRVLAERAPLGSYLADALLFDALNRKDVLSGGGELHSRPNPIAGAVGDGGRDGGRGLTGECWRRAVDVFFRSVRAVRAW